MEEERKEGLELTEAQIAEWEKVSGTFFAQRLKSVPEGHAFLSRQSWQSDAVRSLVG